MTNKSNAERVELLEQVIEVVEGKLTGRGEPVITDEEPSRRFSVGVLNASTPEERTSNTGMRRPNSIGLSIRLAKDSEPQDVPVKIRFSLYYRIQASFEEQTGGQTVDGRTTKKSCLSRNIVGLTARSQE